jgi:hypothetical protein
MRFSTIIHSEFYNPNPIFMPEFFLYLIKFSFIITVLWFLFKKSKSLGQSANYQNSKSEFYLNKNEYGFVFKDGEIIKRYKPSDVFICEYRDLEILTISPEVFKFKQFRFRAKDHNSLNLCFVVTLTSANLEIIAKARRSRTSYYYTNTPHSSLELEICKIAREEISKYTREEVFQSYNEISKSILDKLDHQIVEVKGYKITELNIFEIR